MKVLCEKNVVLFKFSGAFNHRTTFLSQILTKIRLGCFRNQRQLFGRQNSRSTPIFVKILCLQPSLFYFVLMSLYSRGCFQQGIVDIYLAFLNMPFSILVVEQWYSATVVEIVATQQHFVKKMWFLVNFRSFLACKATFLSQICK